MPTSLDIYALTRQRNRPTVERFIASYVDREASDDRTGEELMMLALDAAPGAEERMDQVEWLPVASLADILTQLPAPLSEAAFTGPLPPLVTAAATRSSDGSVSAG